MTRVLLITDTERVLRIFESLETKGALQLRTAATLDQADEEISATVPDFTFVQSRVSGFSGEIQLRHLRKVLPKGAKAILLAGDAVDAAQAKKERRSFIDLTLGDEQFEESVSRVLTGARGTSPKKAAAGDAAGKSSTKDPLLVPSSAPEEITAQPVPVSEESAALPVAVPEEPADPLPTSVPETLGEAEEPLLEEPPSPVQETKKMVQEELPTDLTAPVVEKNRAQPFAEIMELGAAKTDSVSGLLNVEDRVNIGVPLSAPTEGSDRSVGSSEQDSADPLPDGYSRGIPLADAMAHAEKQKRRYMWILPVLLAFLLIPLLSYTAGKKKAPLESGLAATGVSRRVKPTAKAQVPATPKTAIPASNQALSTALTTAMNTVPTMSPAMLPAKAPTTAAPTAPAKAPAPAAPAAPAKTPAIASATPPITKPEAKLIAKPEVKQAAKPEVKPVPEPEAKPIVKAGIKNLPPVMAGAKLDSSYGKTHPGWHRYIDKNAEYTMFKEDDVFRAMQVIALGKETLPNPLLKRLLLEFGGIKRFTLQTAVDKGDYLMERGAAKGGLSLTLYRKKKDLKVKGLVVYYQ